MSRIVTNEEACTRNTTHKVFAGMIKSKTDAIDLLRELNAPEHLVTHARLVGEAASQLISALQDTGLQVDAGFVEIGAAIHDIGKVENLSELHRKGSNHEADGQRLLLDRGVAPKIARICVSHGQWERMECSLEELLVALSDKLWKGNRIQPLEERVIQIISKELNADYWDMYPLLDDCFEAIASEGDARLACSVSALQM